MEFRTILSIFALLFFVSACGGGGSGSSEGDSDGGNPPVAPPSAANCTNTAQDSPAGLRANRIRSHLNGNPTYRFVNDVRAMEDGSPVNIDYMVHPASGDAKALLVLVQGGNGDANISGVDGGAPTTSGGNYLVRSAHLFAAQGYKVVTIDQPSDYSPATANSDYNLYRASIDHAVDLSTIINAEAGNLPVIFAGTSRGAISVVAHQQLADALAISSPVTNDPGVSAAVFEAATNPALRPSSVGVPAHVIWHENDACQVSPPSGSQTLVTNFNPNASSKTVSGGFDADDKVSDCKGHTIHGFFGIESCAVGFETTWMNGLSLTTSPLTVPRVDTFVTQDSTNNLLVLNATSTNPGAVLTYSLPYASTVHGGTVSITGSTVSYTPPPRVSQTTDYFIYVVFDEQGNARHNVIAIYIEPFA